MSVPSPHDALPDPRGPPRRARPVATPRCPELPEPSSRSVQLCQRAWATRTRSHALRPTWAGAAEVAGSLVASADCKTAHDATERRTLVRRSNACAMLTHLVLMVVLCMATPPFVL